MGLWSSTLPLFSYIWKITPFKDHFGAWTTISLYSGKEHSKSQMQVQKHCFLPGPSTFWKVAKKKRKLFRYHQSLSSRSGLAMLFCNWDLSNKEGKKISNMYLASHWTNNTMLFILKKTKIESSMLQATRAYRQEASWGRRLAELGMSVQDVEGHDALVNHVSLETIESLSI